KHSEPDLPCAEVCTLSPRSTTYVLPVHSPRLRCGVRATVFPVPEQGFVGAARATSAPEWRAALLVPDQFLKFGPSVVAEREAGAENVVGDNAALDVGADVDDDRSVWLEDASRFCHPANRPRGIVGLGDAAIG